MAADGVEAGVALETVDSISAISSEDWNRLATRKPACGTPFIQHAFLSALEKSGSVGPGTGWTPSHIVLRSNSRIIAVAPAYLKDHSFGEYVFDHGWAEAYARAGGRYYPKLLSAVPLTPVTGPRLLAEDDDGKKLLARALVTAATRLRLSSAHVTFHQNEGEHLGETFLERTGLQYHWFNRGYRNYDDFLGALSSRKRKALRRERREAGQGLTFRRVAGDDIKERHWDVFWRFYQDTGSRKWGHPYLTRSFFTLLGATAPESVLLIFAEDAGRPVAGALNLIGEDALFGRYWGRIEERPFLHFEVCYHQAIDFAIERGLQRVEAGAQGDHKLARGYEPVLTKSAHWIADPGFRDAVSRFLTAERRQIAAELAAISDETPFKRDGPSPD